MINIPPTPARIYRKRKPTAAKAPAAALVLTAASIDDDVSMVTMQFDRPIDISELDVTTIQVGTITTGGLYQGDGSPTLSDARTVQVALTGIGEYPYTNVKLFADASNGIKAVNDGGTWAGTGGTNLPFP